MEGMESELQWRSQKNLTGGTNFERVILPSACLIFQVILSSACLFFGVILSSVCLFVGPFCK